MAYLVAAKAPDRAAGPAGRCCEGRRGVEPHWRPFIAAESDPVDRLTPSLRTLTRGALAGSLGAWLLIDLLVMFAPYLRANDGELSGGERDVP